MNRLREDDRIAPEADDREISLGIPTILGIFFALVVVCAGFFSLGYSLGRRSAQPAPALTASDSPDTGFYSAPKPAAGSPAGQPAVTAPQPAGNPSTPPVVVVPTSTPAASPAAPAPTPAVVVQQKPASPAPAAPATATPQPPGSFVVQVAAVSSQDVADILVSSLQKKGYAVTVRPEPDKLLHVQIGPFADRKEAEAMRQRVLADGFNAIVK